MELRISPTSTPSPQFSPSKVARQCFVLIAHEDLRQCEVLSLLLRLEGYETSFVADAAGLPTALNQRTPHAVVASMKMQEQCGGQLVRGARQASPGCVVVMVGTSPPVSQIVRALRQGALTVLEEPLDTEALLRELREAIAKDVLILDRGPRGLDLHVLGYNNLTGREREVLQSIANGNSNKETGRNLGISPRTVEVHRARVMEKLGARNTADLMRIILATGGY